jgi:hypothetical protein
MSEQGKIPPPDGAPWATSKLFFKPDVPGQPELRKAMRWATKHMGWTPEAATCITWAFLVASHGGDEQ